MFSVRRLIVPLHLGSRQKAATCHALSNCELRATTTYLPFVMAKGGNPPSIVLLMHRYPFILVLTLHVRWRLPTSPAAPVSASREGGKLCGLQSRRHEAQSGGILGGQLRCALSSESPAVPSTKQTPVSPPLTMPIRDFRASLGCVVKTTHGL